MTTTSQVTESFVFAEQPVISGICFTCGRIIKHSIDDYDQTIMLEIGYRIRTIYFYPTGRTYEKVARSYLHVCPQPVATEPIGVPPARK